MASVDAFLPRAAAEEELNPYLEATLALEQAAQQLDLEDWILQRLKHSERELVVHLPLLRDHGDAVTFTGFRVQHSTARGPALGGLRFAPDAHLSQIQALALARTWQAALLNLPLGGSAGAVVCDPAALSERELQQLTQDYVFALRDLLDPYQDILAPDSGCHERMMAWMLDTYARARGRLAPGVVTGKPAGLWGGVPPGVMTARGLLVLLEEMLAERKASLAGRRVALQGFGQVGATLARLLDEAGARLVAVADISGGLYNDDGLDVGALRAHGRRQGVLFGCAGGEAVRNADVLAAPCDVLVLAAASRQVTSANAAHLEAKLVLEAAPGAVTAAAHEVLESRGVVVAPDLLATAGGLIACYLEWVRNVNPAAPPSGDEQEYLRRTMQAAYREVRALDVGPGTSLRRAAQVLAVGRLAEALRLRGR